MAYFWDNDAHRYRDEAGRFVSRSLVQDYVNKSLASTMQVSDTLSSLVYNGNLSAADFYNSMREEIKREYIRQYLLGNGGQGNMSYSDWGKIGNMLKEQYKYLAGFAQDIAAGNLSEAQIRTLQTRARANMYFNSAREAYETAHAKQAEAWGAVEEKWNVSLAVENCSDCLAFESEGWKPFGYFPKPGTGASKCLTACHCWLTYKNAQGKIYYE